MCLDGSGMRMQEMLLPWMVTEKLLLTTNSEVRIKKKSKIMSGNPFQSRRWYGDILREMSIPLLRTSNFKMGFNGFNMRHLGGSVSQESNPWFVLRPWSHRWWDGALSLALCWQCGVCLRFSVSLSLCLFLAYDCSFSKTN